MIRSTYTIRKAVSMMLILNTFEIAVATRTPDISQCQFCRKCVNSRPSRRLRDTSLGYPLTPRLEKALFGAAEPIVEPVPNKKARRMVLNADKQRGQQQIKDSNGSIAKVSDYTSKEIESFFDGSWTHVERADTRSNHSLCETCTGCTTTLETLAETEVQSSNSSAMTFKPPLGRSSAWTFRSESQKASDGVGIAKLWCIPFKKGHGIKVDKCDPHHYQQIMAKIAGLHKLARDCGVDDLVPGSWVEHVKAIMPGTGYVIDRPGLFSDKAPGVSAKFLASSAAKNNKEDVLRILEAVRSEDVIRASVFDLLIGNCDRHAENIFLGEDGKITLIDNDMALTPKCVVNSIFLPTTKYHAQSSSRNRILDMLDYRCHAPGKQLETHFPDALDKCLKKVQSMTSDDVAELYGFPSVEMSRNLKVRAHQLLTMGFEWTLFESSPLGSMRACMQRYMDRKPCCHFEIGHDNKFQCKDHNHNDELQHFASNDDPCPKALKVSL